MIPSVYIDLEDDVSKIAARLKKERSDQVILVCPRRCQLFSDSINLRLLKKQAELLSKEVFILTMDERGQIFAQEAGFKLKFLPKVSIAKTFSDIRKVPDNFFNPEAGKPNLKQQGQGQVKLHSSLIGQAKEFTNKIIPPKISALVQTKKPDTYFPDQKPEQDLTKKQPEKHTFFRLTLSLVVISLGIAAALLFWILPKADVSIFLKSEPITRDMEISALVNTTDLDVNRMIIPAQKISETLEASSTFQSQGKKEVGNKAMGMVRIYNFTKQSLNLKANTTTLTVGAKTYNLTADAMQIRPTTYKNASTKEVDASSLSEPLEIIASAGGESFNIPAGTRMEISNQVFGSKPQFLYAKSETAITGGTSRFLSVVSDQDITASQGSLKDKILAQINEKLKSAGLVLLDKAMLIEPISFSSNKPAGTESPSFEATLSIKITLLTYKRSDLQELVLGRIKQTLSSNKQLEATSQFWDENTKLKSIDLNQGLLVVFVHFEGKALTLSDFKNINSQLVNKTPGQAEEILKSRPEVEKAEIVLSPSWQKRFPLFKNRIQVTVKQ